MEQTNLFKDIKAWLSKGRAAAFTKFQPIWKSSKYSLRTKINLYSNVGEIKQRRMRCLGHVLLKKYSDFGGGKKKSDSEFLSYNLMLNSGQKFRALRDKKNKYSNSCVVRNNISERNKKPSVKWMVPKSLCGNNFVDSIYRLSVNIKLIYIYTSEN